MVHAVSGLHASLSEVLRTARECGSWWLQVNLGDEVVARGLRLDVLDPPVTGFVTVGGPPEAEAGFTQRLTGLAGTVRGWRVETEAPIPPVEVADGERLDALANVAVLRRPDDLAEDDWLRTWKDDHTPVAIRTQGTVGYVQHRVLEPLAGSPRVAAIVEEHFPMAALDDVHAFYGSGGDDAELSRRVTELMASCARFGADRDLDLVPTSRYRWQLR